MRGDVMGWIGRLVAVVFGLGVLALLGAVAVLVRQAEGVPPMPVFLGMLGLVLLILLAGACLALISIAVSARRGVAALHLLSAGRAVASGPDLPEEATEAEVTGAPRAGAVPPRAAPRPQRALVAER